MNTRDAAGWDKRYDGDGFLFGTEPNSYIKDQSHRFKPNSRVLCLADGEGRNGVYLSTLGHHVTSIDQSAVGLHKAQALAKDRQVELKTVQADLTTYDLQADSYDAIVSIFFHIPQSLQAIIYPRVIGALKPGGLFILESYRPEQLEYGTGGPPAAELMLTEDLIKQQFGSLEVHQLASVEREVIEGSGHTGLAAVVQFIGEKRK